MEREGGNKNHPKWVPVPARNMQRYAPPAVNVNVVNPITNNTVPLAAPVTVPGPLMPTGSAKPNQNRHTGPDTNPSQVQPRAPAREQDQYLPIANVIRIMRRILPPHAKISDEAKETVQECVSEYISFITGEANDRCRSEQRKTVTAEDVLWAMTKLGFDNYIPPLSLYLNRYRELESDRNSVNENPVTGKRRAAEYSPLIPVMPAPAYASPPFSRLPGMFYNPAPADGEYFVPPDGSSAGTSGGASSSGQDNAGPMMLSNFDPFAPFK